MTTVDENEPQGKQCSKCKQWYSNPTQHFNKDKSVLSGLASRCKICTRQINLEYKRNNIEKVREANRKYNRQRPYRKPKPKKVRTVLTTEERRTRRAEKNREYSRNWKRNNPDKIRVYQQTQNARRRALEATFTPDQWQACLEYFHHTCAYCGAQQSFWHVLEQEHVIPVTSGGNYAIDNIVPACKTCNASKNNTPITDWLNNQQGKRKAALIIARIEAYFEWVKGQ